MRAPVKPNAERAARVFGCTVAQSKAMMARNSVSLTQMADKAARTGRKVNGYTESELRASAADYLEASK